MSTRQAINRLALEVTVGVIAPAVVASAAYWLWDTYYGPGSLSRGQRKLVNKNLRVLRERGLHLDLNEHEQIIAAEIIHPDDIDVDFTNVGGLESTITSIRESLIYPLVYPHLFPTSSLLTAPKGVLLYGPPGCGKTLLAKAIAREGRATFINISASVLTSKWYGETNKLVAAMFSLARKCAPSIIFLDEIDSFLRERSKGDHEVSSMMKAEFMTLWDGLTTSTDRIVVLGATNRMDDIDSAFLRRMPKRYPISLPDAAQRLSILQLLLKDMKVEEDFNLKPLADATPTFSGSDLKELCRNAALRGMRESMAALHHGGVGIDELSTENALVMKPLSLFDFVDALKEMAGVRAYGVEGVDRNQLAYTFDLAPEKGMGRPMISGIDDRRRLEESRVEEQSEEDAQRDLDERTVND